MAAVPKEFINSITELRGLRANKDFTRFHYRFKSNGREFYKTIDYTHKSWTKSERKRQARKEAEKFREEKITEIENPFNPNTTLNFIAKEYFDKKCKSTEWTKARKRLYELYIEPFIGNKKASRIIEHDIDTIRKFMQENGYSKQNKNGNSIRSIEKVLLQTLKPILEYAESNGALVRKIPNINIPISKEAKNSRKKVVQNASEKLSLLYKTIQNRYKDDPFYRALFLFALFGRRWNEIRTLKWSDIDLNKNIYTIRAQNNKIGIDQTYELPLVIKEALLQLQGDQGLIFKSPITGKEMHPPRKQLNKIKEDTGIGELTMHYFRHILVTALGEMGTAATVLSASLGHTKAETVDEYYRTINHLKGSKDANKQLENIINAEVI
ncbi:Integrase [hydrothermal vent metagenome]|uniref:Integrase n=1 Tax=hydrothermal vent metagenome TaxID=652676 RepID=A0A1W1BXR1_9ZZZZ